MRTRSVIAENDPISHSGPSSAVRMMSIIARLSAPTLSRMPSDSLIHADESANANAAPAPQSNCSAAAIVAPSAASEPIVATALDCSRGANATTRAVRSGMRIRTKSIGFVARPAAPRRRPSLRYINRKRISRTTHRPPAMPAA